MSKSTTTPGELFRARRRIYDQYHQLSDKDRSALADELDQADKFWHFWEIAAKYNKILYTDYGVEIKGCYGDENAV